MILAALPVFNWKEAQLKTKIALTLVNLGSELLSWLEELFLELS